MIITIEDYNFVRNTFIKVYVLHFISLFHSFPLVPGKFLP